MNRTLLAGLATTTWLAATAAPALAAPANDDFEAARALGGTLPFTVGGTLAGATRQDGDPTSQIANAWYAFTPAATGPVSLDLPQRDSSVDYKPRVYTGPDRGHLTPVATTAHDPWSSRARFDAVAGQTYRVMVAGWQPDGSFTLRARSATPPANDDFADARRLRVPGLYAGNLEDATVQLGEPTQRGMHATEWYRLQPRHSSRITVEAVGTHSYPGVTVYTGSRLSSLHRIAEHVTTARFAAQAGHVYRVRISASGGDVGDYSLDVSDGSIKGKGVHMAVRPGQTTDSVRRHGLRLDVGARRMVGVAIDLRVDRRTARRLGSRDQVIGHVRGRLGYHEDAPATIRLERGARRALAHHHRLDATLRLELLDHAPNRVLNVPVHLRRVTMGA